MVRIVTDSTADLSPRLAVDHGVMVVPLMVHHAGHTYRDGLDLTQERLFRLVEEIGELPKTSAPTVSAFSEAFCGADRVVFVGISSKLSACVQNARLAAEECGVPVHVVDSLNVSTGIGLLALEAAMLRDAGYDAEEIERNLLDSVPKVRTSFVIDTLRYLHMGGRCTAIQSLVGSLLKLRPIIGVAPDGTLGVRDKVRGKRERALQVLLSGLSGDLPALDGRRVFVTHTACPDDARFLADEVQRIASPDEVLITEAGTVISSHCGPRTIGILYKLQ